MTNLDKYSFPTPKGNLLLSTQAFPNGNMVGYTSQILTLGAAHLVGTEYLNKYIGGLDECELSPGVYSRQPETKANTSVDDYLSATCSQFRARRCLDTARFHYGFLDVNYPSVSKSQWMVRFQGLWQHMKISSGAFVGPVGRLIWAISIVIAAHKPFSWQDSWIQSHLMILVKERRNFISPICSLAAWYWRKRKGSMPTWKIMADYVGPDCQDHPLIDAWRPYE